MHMCVRLLSSLCWVKITVVIKALRISGVGKAVTSVLFSSTCADGLGCSRVIAHKGCGLCCYHDLVSE